MGELSVGAVFAGCRIDGVIARGGMGVVYRATDLALGRTVAIKLIAADRAAEAEYRSRFQREVRLTAAIDHPNVVPVYAGGEHDGELYLVMRFVDGTDLRALLGREGSLEPARAEDLLVQVAAALDAAHAAGVVHRDVKPANILITAGGRGEHAYLSDFGIVGLPEAGETSLTDSGAWLGTVDFAAPEQLSAEPTGPRTDVYALGCVLVAMLTGEAPFRRGSAALTIAAQLHDSPPLLAPGSVRIPSAVDGVMAKALAKDPAQRYASAGDLARAFSVALNGPVVADQSAAPGREVAGSPGGQPSPPLSPADRAAAELGTAHGFGLAGPAGGQRAADETALTSVRPVVPIPGAGESLGQGASRRSAGGVASGDQAIVSPPSSLLTDDGSTRIQSAPPEQLTRQQAAKPKPLSEPPPDRSLLRRRWPWIAAAVLLIALLIGLRVAVVGGAFDEPIPSTEVSQRDVRTAAKAFADAYSREDPAALRAALSGDVKRVTPGDQQLGRDAVVAVYQRQFEGSEIKDYSYEDLQVTGGVVGRATGTYTVKRKDRADITGQIVLGVIDVDGAPRISLIAAEPAP